MEKTVPFVCSCGGYTFIIRFEKDHELHIFSSRDKEEKKDPTVNWTQKFPKGTSNV